MYLKGLIQWWSQDVRMAEKLAMHVAYVAEKDDFQENH